MAIDPPNLNYPSNKALVLDFSSAAYHQLNTIPELKMKRFPLLLLFLFIALCVGCGEEEGPVAPPVAAPSHLIAGALSPNQVLLRWTDNSVSESGFRIERAPGGATNWTRIASVGYDTTTYLDRSLSEGTSCCYRVKAYLLDRESDPTEYAEVCTPPLAPTGLTAVQDANNVLQINLTWNDTSRVETGYQLQRKRTGSQFETIDTLEADASSYQDTGLSAYTTYYYRLKALLDTIPSTWSNEANAYTRVLTPRPPSSLEATSSHTNPNQVRLTWTDNSEDELGFVIERRIPDVVEWTKIDTTQANRTSYTNTGLQTETTYQYRIYAYNEYGSSDYSNIAEETTPEGPPIAPSNLRQDAQQLAYNRVVLLWDDNSADELWFNVQRRYGSERWGDIAQVDADIDTYIDTAVAQNTIYQYRVNAENNIDASEWSNILEVTTPVGPPNPPRNLNAESMGIDQIRLTWQDASGNEDAFLIERKAEGEDEFLEYDMAAQNSVYYLDTGLEPETWFWYRVRALNIDFTSEPSNVDSAQTWSLTVFEDDFESYTVGEPPDDPAWNYGHSGSSYIEVSETNPHGSAKSVYFYDADMGNNSCHLDLSHRSVQHATLSCWLYISSQSHLGILGGDSRNILTFQLQFNDDNSFYVRSGANMYVGGDSYPVDQWFLLEITFNTNDGMYMISFNSQAVVENLYLQQGPNHPDNAIVIFMTYSDAECMGAYLDDVGIIMVVEEGGVQAPPISPVSLEGAAKVSDVEVLYIKTVR